MQSYGEVMQDGQMRPSTIVLPQALPVGWYVNSKDGQLPVEKTAT